MAQENDEQSANDLINLLMSAMNEMNPNVVNNLPLPKKKVKASQYALENQMKDLELTKGHLKKCKDCPICKVEFKLTNATSYLPCKHFFHDLCLIEWLKSNNTCPLCRFELKTTDYEYEASKWKDDKSKDDKNKDNDSFLSMYG